MWLIFNLWFIIVGFLHPIEYAVYVDARCDSYRAEEMRGGPNDGGGVVDELRGGPNDGGGIVDELRGGPNDGGGIVDELRGGPNDGGGVVDELR